LKFSKQIRKSEESKERTSRTGKKSEGKEGNKKERNKFRTNRKLLEGRESNQWERK
jgi:hypothetical protein